MTESWWVIEGATFLGHVLKQAPHGRAALAAARRALIEAERGTGSSRRHAEQWVRDAQLRIMAGPWSLEQAIEFETGMRWAWAICDLTTGDRSAPSAPATRHEAHRYLGMQETERIEQLVRKVYAPHGEVTH